MFTVSLVALRGCIKTQSMDLANIQGEITIAPPISLKANKVTVVHLTIHSGASYNTRTGVTIPEIYFTQFLSIGVMRFISLDCFIKYKGKKNKETNYDADNMDNNK